jgi:hypothetical protein
MGSSAFYADESPVHRMRVNSFAVDPHPATAISGRVARRQQGRWASREAEQQTEAEQQAPPPQDAYAARPPQSEPAADTGDMLAQLKQLGELKTAGRTHRRGIRDTNANPRVVTKAFHA